MIVVAIHNHMLFRKIERLLHLYKDQVLIVIPQFNDPDFDQMGIDTKSLLDADGWETKFSTDIKDSINCEILLEPYTYQVTCPVIGKWRGRFIYGVAKDYWNFSQDNNLPFDFVMTYGPIDDSIISAFTETVHVGSMQAVPKKQNRNQCNKPILLYLPTYGSSSNLKNFNSLFMELKNVYEVHVKLHHGSRYLDDLDLMFMNDPEINIIEYTSDTLEAIDRADVVLTDVSGVIADVVSMKKPLVILDTSDVKLVDALPRYLVENGFAWMASDSSEVMSLVERASKTTLSGLEDAHRQILWETGDEAVQVAHDFLNKLIKGEDRHLIKKLENRRELRQRILELMERNEQENLSLQAERDSFKELLEKVLRESEVLKKNLKNVANQLEIHELNGDINEAIIEDLNQKVKTLETVSRVSESQLQSTRVQLELIEINFETLKLQHSHVLASKTYRMFNPWRKIRNRFKNFDVKR
jgi:hypothetical protein